MATPFSFEPVPPAFELLGPRWDTTKPLWKARVSVVAEATTRAARMVYASSESLKIKGSTGKRAHLPGTMLLRVRVNEVTVQFGNAPFAFVNAASPPQMTVLVAANPESCTGSDPVAIEQMVCIAGQTPLEPFYGPKSGKLPNEFNKQLKRVFPAGIKNLSLSSSGFIFDGCAKIPDNVVLKEPAPYLLEAFRGKAAEAGGEGVADGTFAIRIDEERLSEFPAARQELLSYFSRLVERLNPNKAGLPQFHWLRLELSDPTDLPSFYWKCPPDPNKPVEVAFSTGEWKLLLSDQSLRNPKTPTRGALAAKPDVQLAADGVTVTSPTQFPSTPAAGVLAFSGRIDKAGEVSERIEISSVKLGYNAARVASELRDVYDLDPPRIDDTDEFDDGARLTGLPSDSDGKIGPSVLWGFVPLADGWVQLPFFNLTSQLLVDALPRLTPAPTILPEPPSPIRGGAMFGTDRPEVFSRDDGKLPWNVTVREATAYQGKWTFGNEPEAPVDSVSLRLANPVINCEGLLHLGTTRPSPADALATLDNWVSGLNSLELATPAYVTVKHEDGTTQVVPEDEFPCPFLLDVAKLELQRVKPATAGGSAFSVPQIVEWRWSYIANPLVHRGTVLPKDVGEVGDKPVQRDFPFHAWLTALPRSRFPLEDFWGVKQTELPVGAKLADHAQSALAWRRHPSHPCVHVLPLTQNGKPMNSLCASRQLTPFRLPVEVKSAAKFNYLVPVGWRFVTSAADYVPHIDGQLLPESEWQTNPRLVIATLGIPGAALGPTHPKLTSVIPDPSKYLDRFLYRHDLPLLDQLNSLASLPPQKATDEPPPKAMGRADFSKHWADLESKAVLAEVDEAEAALTPDGADPLEVDIRGLMEPRVWPATFALDVSEFPGSLVFSDRKSPARKVELVGDDAARDALRGLDGDFREDEADKLRLDDASTASVKIVAGSYTASIEKNAGVSMLRDQRGLLRGATAATSKLITTPLALVGKSGAKSAVLCTLRAPAPFKVGNAEWLFWAKALPTVGAGPFIFDKASTESTQGTGPTDPRSPRRGVNDPGADGRDLGHLNGYEWRLGLKPGPANANKWLPLGRLRFFPLSLEAVEISVDGEVASFKVIGRLQLPSWEANSSGPPAARELVNRDSSVLLTFRAGKLCDIARAPNDPDHGAAAVVGSASWPLVDRDADVDAPVVFWDVIQGETNLAGDELVAFVLPANQYRIVFSRLATNWTINGSKPLRFQLDGTNPPELELPNPDLTSSSEVIAEEVVLKLDLEKGAHSLKLNWAFRVGTIERLQLRVEMTEQLVAGELGADAFSAYLVHRDEEAELDIVRDAAPVLEGYGLSVSWRGFEPAGAAKKKATPATTQLLPGFELADEPDSCSGFGMLTFARLPDSGGWPRFKLVGAYSDILFKCCWGGLLQERLQKAESVPEFETAFNSSSGRVLAEYHMAFAPDTARVKWPWELSLSGFVEIKSLISWPTALAVDSRLTATIPAVSDSPWKHWRHTIGILLSEHRLGELNAKLPGDVPLQPILVGSPEKDCFFTLREGATWSFPATVEHQFVALDVDSNTRSANGPAVTSFTGEVRWTTVQEVRFCHPLAFYNHLAGLFKANVVDPVERITRGKWAINSSWNSLHGWHARTTLDALKMITGGSSPRLKPFAQTRLSELATALLVEATVPLFLGVDEAPNRLGAPIASAPLGSIVSSPSAIDDFGHDPRATASSDQWLFLQVPFLGRLQPKVREETQDLFATDPVKSIADLPGGSPVDVVLRLLTNRTDKGTQKLATAAFDGPAHRCVRRLDPSSLAEAWFRLLCLREQANPHKAPELPSGITKAAASEAAIVSALPSALLPLFDPRRSSLPPRELAQPVLPPADDSSFVWTPESLVLLETSFSPHLDADHPYAFLHVPLALAGTDFIQPQRKESHRRTAATLLPTPPLPGWKSSQHQPVSLALPPFASLSYQAWAKDQAAPPTTTLLTTAELVAFDATRSKAEVVSEQLIFPKDGASEDQGLIDWATQTIARLAADSPTAILRLRALLEVGDKQGIEVTYRFLEIPLPSGGKQLARQATAIRAEPDRVRFPQGQFGGCALPMELYDDFELAPPLVRGAQPLRLLKRTSPGFDWPWGMAGLRFSTSYRQLAGVDVGTVGPLEDAQRVWWQAQSLRLQFAVALDRQLLPAGFRISAVPGFLPVWHAAPMAAIPATQEANDKPLFSHFDKWVPVLPARRRWLITGLRPGAPFAIRDSLVAHSIDKHGDSISAVTSASVPVQHRAPRPVLLPAPKQNRQDVALRTWGSWFDLQPGGKLERTVAVYESPAAEFSLLPRSPSGVVDGNGIRLQLCLPSKKAREDLSESDNTDLENRVYPQNGEIPRGWKGDLLFSIEELGKAGDFSLSATVVISGETFLYDNVKTYETDKKKLAVLFSPKEAIKSRLQDSFRAAHAGDSVLVCLSAQYHGGTIKKYVQTSTFLTRVAETPFPPPLSPRFLTWEDPEYNRRLASFAARKERMLPNGDKGPATIALVADRREYNANGKIIYALVSRAGASLKVEKLEFTFFIIRSDGTATPTEASPVTSALNSLPDVTDCDLEVIRNGNPLKPGDILRIKATCEVNTTPQTLELDLSIVAEPVIPAPEAAYAVLRRTDKTDECVRFAWGPNPDRIELVDPDDLFGEVVRRRAVYTSIDVLNLANARTTRYALQKTTPGGSTHFPAIIEQST